MRNAPREVTRTGSGRAACPVPRAGIATLQSAILWGLVAAACLFGAWARWRAFWGPPALGDGVTGLIAHNYLKYGFRDLGLAQIVSPGPVLPLGERMYYQTHPPLAPMLGAVGVALFGPTTQALRFAHVVLGLVLAGGLAWLAWRLYGRVAGLWALVAAAALPIAATYGGMWPEQVGPALLCFCVLASALYHRYSEDGRWASYWLLLAAAALALWTDWPAYLMAFVLAGHALVYRTRTHRWAMLLLPACAVAAFGGLMLYALATPESQNLYGSLSGMLSGWTLGEGGDEVPPYTAVMWVRNFMWKYVEQFSPLGLLALIWAATRLPAVFRRDNHRDHHLLMLWLWPAAFALALHRIFYVHVHYHVLFLPAVALSLGAFGAWVFEGSRLRRLRLVAGAAGGVFLILWSHDLMTGGDGRAGGFREHQVAWAREVRRQVPFEGEAAIALHYSTQMRFLADRRMEESVDTMAKVEALGDLRGGAVKRLFVPLGYPVGEPGFGARLIARYPAEAGEQLVSFSVAAPYAPDRLPTLPRPHGPLALSGGVALERAEWAFFEAGEGKQLLYLGWSASGLPRARGGETLVWRVRFSGPDGRRLGQAEVAAKPAASSFLPVPGGWKAGEGRAELMLVHKSWDVASLGLPKRLIRLALRLGTFGLVGAPRPVEALFLVDGKAPIELSP